MKLNQMLHQNQNQSENLSQCQNQLSLRPYQEEDLTTITRHTSFGIFNEQRTGKTPTSIMAMEQNNYEHLLIVCPASMLYKWKQEYEAWTGKTALIVPSPAVIKKKGLDTTVPALIVNYENLRGSSQDTYVLKYIAHNFKPDGLIVDEAHRCKDRHTLNFRAINSFNKVKYRYYLTGTPAPNRPHEVWSILHFIDPTTFTSYWKFIEEYFTVADEVVSMWQPPVKVIGDFKDGAKGRLANLLNQYSIQRKRRDVMPWLPKEEAPTIIKLTPTPTQKKYITQLKDEFRVEDIECESTLVSLTRMRQVCAAPKILGLKGSSPKIDWVAQYLKDYPDKSVIIFSNSRKLLSLVSCECGCKLITGSTDLKERHNYISAFQNNIINVLGIQTQAGKEGLTLDKADVTIFLDVYPPAADYNQAKDRMVATTINNVKPKEIIHLMMAGTYDEQLYSLVRHNISQTEVINDYINYLKE